MRYVNLTSWNAQSLDNSPSPMVVVLALGIQIANVVIVTDFGIQCRYCLSTGIPRVKILVKKGSLMSLLTFHFAGFGV